MSASAAHRPASTPDVVRPRQLAHIVFHTNDLQAMTHWYECVLCAEVTFANDRVAFLTFDEEHHRVALVATATYAPSADVSQVVFYHAAFTYASLGELIATYERLQSGGIAPYRTIHHGPTVSLYYRDPDRNAIELQVDAFPDAQSAKRWMSGETFTRNPIGIELDMNAYVAAFRAGVPEATLLRRPDDL